MVSRFRGRDRNVYRSWTNSHQIDDREQRDPDDVEGVPEQRKADEATLDIGAKALDGDLHHHHSQPEQTGSDMQPVAADEREEGGQKRAALRGRALRDHVGELAQLENKERGAEYERDQGKEICGAA